MRGGDFGRFLLAAAILCLGSGCTVSKDGLLIVGTTGPFRHMSDGERDQLYRTYLAIAAKSHPGAPPRLDAAAFQAKLAGWASIQTFGIPGIMSWRSRVLVPTGISGDTRFASAAGSFLFATTGDLVAARQDEDGLVWLDRVLCRDDASYRTCAETCRPESSARPPAVA